MNILDKLLIRRIPKEIFEFEEMIIHISDTPDVVFSYIRRLIKILKPKVLIHTGDMVDNIKLEFNQTKINLYEKKLQDLMMIFKEIDQVYYCLGNHDDLQVINKYLGAHETLVLEGQHFASNCKLAFAHEQKNIKSTDVDFIMYGHCPDVEILDKKYLNGLDWIYVIDGKTRRVAKIPYPKDINDFRLKRHSLGL